MHRATTRSATPGSSAEATYGKEINLRCARYGDAMGLLWPVARYIDGLKSLKPGHPERVVFAAIVGIPDNLPINLSFDDILALPAMQFTTDPDTAGSVPAPSCTRPSSDPARAARVDKAYPARRFVEVAKAFGASSVLHSICADSYTPALNTLIDKVAATM
jgi:hypothetical protein